MTTFGDETQVDDGSPLQVRTYSGGALGTNDRVQFRGLPVATAPESTGFGTGFVGAPAAEEAPLFLRVFKHLLPRAKAWRLTIDKTLRQFFAGLAPIGDDVKNAADCAYLDLFPQSTRRLSEWEQQFNLPNSSLTEQERRDRLDAAWKATGSLSPRYLQDTLQALGFDVYVHEWWEPGSEPPVGVKQCVTPRNPFLYLLPSNTTPGAGVDCGEPLAECGEPFAECGNSSGALGYPLVNKIRQTRPDVVTGCGEPAMECGETRAECGDYNEVTDSLREYVIPNDPDKWPYFVYIGGQNFPDLATVPTARRDEFEATLLKYVRASNWIGVLVSYN